MSAYALAKFYDILLYPFLNKTRKITARVIQRLHPESLIDICCGTGNQLKYLGHTKIKLTGIDNSPAMLRAAKLFNCYQQDARSLEFPDQWFDMALIQLALHEKRRADQQQIIHEAFRIIKKNGYLVIFDYHITPKTSMPARVMVHSIEFLAGKQHYRYFKEYHKQGGLTTLIDPTRFETIHSIPLAGKTFVLKVYRKIDQS
ncbi:MAG: methyltransferase domain-containing protein [Bacteroidales bacterium]|jgi:demethylmenaquinone methyltransferase/2-methoxy-6-polyprenyl-1,4-benzoquinol methylase|nr:methyltransferase domain-containing protein [Bacteroidales bacterium]